MTDRFTAKQKRECAEREVRQRLRVYPRLVEQEKMSAIFAAEQTACMEAIAKDYAALEEKEKLI